jgi:hypothetical protein
VASVSEINVVLRSTLLILTNEAPGKSGGKFRPLEKAQSQNAFITQAHRVMRVLDHSQNYRIRLTVLDRQKSVAR